MRQSFIGCVSLAAALAFTVAFASAYEDPKKPIVDAAKAAVDKAVDKATGQSPTDPAQGGMPPFAAPGPHHEHLKQFVGEWECETKFYIDGTDEPQVSTGTFKRELTMGGRHLHGMYTSKMDGMDFQGAELMGYDNVRQTYYSIWVDNMSTSLAREEGTCDAGGKIFTLTGDNINGMTGKPMKSKSITKVVDADTILMTAFEVIDGKDKKVMEITCKRKKAAA